MPTLLIRFPGRRYHATPWAHHVNEGMIEWPPSPWRIVRALLSVGYTKCQWEPEKLTSPARSLLLKLCEAPPVYCLPQSVGAHSRHYMPLARFKNGTEEKTLVFDTWARIDDGILAVTWDIELSKEEGELLASLAAKLGYLGRSESWVDARLANEGEQLPEPNCFPSDMPPAIGWEHVSLIAPLDQGSFEDWRKKALTATLADLDEVDESKKRLSKAEKKLLDQRKKAMAPYPADLIDALQKDTNWLRDFGWSQPPGSRRVFYHRRCDALKVGTVTHRAVHIGTNIKAMLLAMATATGNKHALPPVIYTLIQGERLHKALVCKAGAHNTALSGCDKHGAPLKGRHEHAHILPLDLDNDGHLEHFLVWSPMGLDDVAQKAVRTVRTAYAKGTDALRIALAASCGELTEFDQLPGPIGKRLCLLLGLSPSINWISHTPFIPPRHLKPRGKNSIEGQILAELESRGLPRPNEIHVVDPREQPEYLRHRHFRRMRKNGPSPPIDCGFTIALRFDTPVNGPICLGYGSHFGLGLFIPAE